MTLLACRAISILTNSNRRPVCLLRACLEPGEVFDVVHGLHVRLPEVVRLQQRQVPGGLVRQSSFLTLEALHFRAQCLGGK